MRQAVVVIAANGRPLWRADRTGHRAGRLREHRRGTCCGVGCGRTPDQCRRIGLCCGAGRGAGWGSPVSRMIGAGSACGVHFRPPSQKGARPVPGHAILGAHTSRSLRAIQVSPRSCRACRARAGWSAGQRAATRRAPTSDVETVVAMRPAAGGIRSSVMLSPRIRPDAVRYATP